MDNEFERTMNDAADAAKDAFSKRGRKNKKSGKPGNAPKRILTGIAIAILVFVAAEVIFGSFYTIAEEEQAVVCTFGQASAVTTPGLHFKIPFVQTVDKVNTTIQGFAIGYSNDEYTDVNYNGANGISDGTMITSDYNFIEVDFYLEYRVIDPVKAMYAS